VHRQWNLRRRVRGRSSFKPPSRNWRPKQHRLDAVDTPHKHPNTLSVALTHLLHFPLQDNEVKKQLTRLVTFDNVPLKLKPKKFTNFVRESLALFGDDNATIIEQMWEIFETVVRECKIPQ